MRGFKGGPSAWASDDHFTSHVLKTKHAVPQSCPSTRKRWPASYETGHLAKRCRRPDTEAPGSSYSVHRPSSAQGSDLLPHLAAHSVEFVAEHCRAREVREPVRNHNHSPQSTLLGMAANAWRGSDWVGNIAEGMMRVCLLVRAISGFDYRVNSRRGCRSEAEHSREQNGTS